MIGCSGVGWSTSITASHTAIEKSSSAVEKVSGLYWKCHSVSGRRAASSRITFPFRLLEGLEQARRLGEHIAAVNGLSLFTPRIETNIVFFDPSGAGLTSQQVYEGLLKRGVRMGLTYGNMIRAVTHLDVSRDDIEKVGRELKTVVAELKG